VPVLHHMSTHSASALQTLPPLRQLRFSVRPPLPRKNHRLGLFTCMPTNYFRLCVCLFVPLYMSAHGNWLQWTGTCIGRRNYPVFFVFISSMAASTVLMCFLCILLLLSWQTDRTVWTNPLDDSSDLQRALGVVARLIVPAPLLLWSLGAFTFVGALTAFHTYLIILGRTTAEWMRLPLVHSELLSQRWTKINAALKRLLADALGSLQDLVAPVLTVGIPVRPRSMTTLQGLELNCRPSSSSGCTSAASPLHLSKRVAGSDCSLQLDKSEPPLAIQGLIRAWCSSESRILPMAYPASVCDDVLQLELMLLNIHAINDRLKEKMSPA
jgi:hypothetical protein